MNLSIAFILSLYCLLLILLSDCFFSFLLPGLAPTLVDDRELAWGLIGEWMLSRMDGSLYVSQSNFCIHRQYSHGCYPEWMLLSIQFLRIQKIYQSIKPGRQSCLDPDDTVDGHMNKNQVKTFSIELSIHIMSGWVGL